MTLHDGIMWCDAYVQNYKKRCKQKVRQTHRDSNWKKLIKENTIEGTKNQA